MQRTIGILIFSQSCYDANNIQEIVISDGGSKDNTVSVVKNMLDKFPISLQVINSKPGTVKLLISRTSKGLSLLMALAKRILTVLIRICSVRSLY